MAKEAETGSSGSADTVEQKILKALRSGDYTVTYMAPKNITERTAPDGRTFYVIDPWGDSDCGCEIKVAGYTFTGWVSEEGGAWECDDGDVNLDDDLCDALDEIDQGGIHSVPERDRFVRFYELAHGCSCDEVYSTEGDEVPLDVEETDEMFGGIENVVAQSVAVIGAGRKKISENAYCRNAVLEHVDIAKGVEWIGDGAFYGCQNLKSVAIPSSVKRIGASAFGECPNLAVVSFGEGLESISNRAFDGCRALSEVKLPSTVTAIGGAAFRDCTSLIRFSFPGQIKTISHAVLCDCKALLRVDIHEGVTDIERAAFYGCSKLKEIAIPHGVRRIGIGAFRGCVGLTSVTIPKGAKVERDAFDADVAITRR